MNNLWNILKRVSGHRRDDNAMEPLDHPALSRMTLAQLADLPMPSKVKENCNGSIRVVQPSE